MALPVEINPLFVSQTSGYTISRSLRFRSSAGAYLSRTPATTTNQTTWTWSGWMKRGALSNLVYLFAAGTSSQPFTSLRFDTGNDQLWFETVVPSSVVVGRLITTQVLRDPSAWYHIVAVWDTTNATASNRMRLYINGVQVTAFGTATYPSLNATSQTNGNVAHTIASNVGGGNSIDCYLAEINFIDGQALSPSSFGAFDVNGIWQPAKYTGTYGTNGFYLPFSMNSASAYGATFNGSSQRLSVATPAASLINWWTSNFTLEYWINPTAFPSGTTPNLVGNLDPASGANYWSFGPMSNGTVQFYWYSGTSNSLSTTQTIPLGSWSHLAFVKNGTTLTIYINGVSAATTTLSNTPLSLNTYPLSIGAANNIYFNGALSNLRIVNGTAVYTSNFTPPTSALTAITNTSFLTLQSATIVDNSTNAYTITNTGSVATSTQYPFTLNIAADASGNANSWTPNNISLASGTTYDSMIDSPTNYADGGNGRGNYAVLNQLDKVYPGATFSNGNLDITTSAAQNYAKPTIFPASGKWYCEFTINAKANSTFNQFAIYVNSATDAIYAGYEQTGQYYNGSAWNGSAVYSAWAVGGIIGVAMDLDGGTVRYYYNNVAQGSGTISIPTGNPTGPVIYSQAASNGVSANFGQRPFTYTPPTGFKALNTYNLPAPTIKVGNKHMDVSVWSGTGVNQAVTNSGGFQPDFVWDKSRSSATLTHILTDSVRGVNSQLFSPLTNAEETRTDRIQSFNSNGFTVGTYTDVNQSGQTFVGWQWKGGNGTASNTSGSVTSTVSANASAGFSVVGWTEPATTPSTVGHGLGVAPSMVIAKARGTTSNWAVYHKSLGATQAVQLNLTNAAGANTSWNSTAPTSTVFTTNFGWNATGVAYCFAEVAGFSKFGSYTGNGSADGTFVYTGFRPKFILVKRTDTTGNWVIWDSLRLPYNTGSQILYPNLSNAEGGTSSDWVDMLSNGFKLRGAGADENASGGTYIYAAFAENPFNYSRAR